MTITRRGFMKAILAAGVAPSVVGSGILMPVRTIWRQTREFEILYPPDMVPIDIAVSLGEYVKQWEKDADLYAGIPGGATNNRIREALAGGRPLPWKDVLAYSGRYKA